MDLFSKDELKLLKKFVKEAAIEDQRLYHSENKANNSNNIKLDVSLTKNLYNKPSPNQKKLLKLSPKPSSIKPTQSFEEIILPSPPNKSLHKTEEMIFLNTNELIEYFTNLNKETFYDEIKTLNDEFIIKENDFYHTGKSPNIQLFYAIIENFEIKDDNQYFKKNLDTLEKIINHINNNEIKYIQLDTFFNDAKDIIIEKLNLLTILPDSDIEPEKHYDILLNYYKDIKQILDKLSSYKNSLEKVNESPRKIYLYKINKYIEEIQSGTYDSFSKLRPKI